MVTEKRRAYRGHTHDPFDCCGRDAGSHGRPKGKICGDCANLIIEGKAARERAASEKQAGQLAVYMWTSTDYGWPRFYGPWEWPHKYGDGGDLQDRLNDAMWKVVNAVAQVAPADTPNHAPTFKMEKRYHGHGMERNYDAWPRALSDTVERVHTSDHWSWPQLVLMNPATRDAVDALYQAVRSALAGVYQEGKARGGSLLLGLANGEKTLSEFEDGLAIQGKPRR